MPKTKSKKFGEEIEIHRFKDDKRYWYPAIRKNKSTGADSLGREYALRGAGAFEWRFKPKTETTVKNSVTGECPFCKLEVSAGLDVENEDGVLLHSMPPCDDFLKLDALTFMTKFRKHNVGPAPWDNEN